MSGYRHIARGPDRARPPVEYATVKGTVANFTDGAVLLSSDKVTMAVWLPRRALDPTSQALLYRATRGQDVEIRVDLKLALARGLV